MAIITISNTGGNWNATTAWVGGVIPTALDDVVSTITSGPLTLNTSTAVAKSVNFTNYTNIFSLTVANGVIRLSGDLTLSTGMTITGTLGYLVFLTNATWTSNGKTWTGNYTVEGVSLTINLGDDAIIGGLTTHTTVGATHTINGFSLSMKGNITASSGRVFAGTTVYKIATATTQAVSGTFQSDLTIVASGTVTLTSIIFSPTTNKTLTYTSGIIPPGTGTLTLTPTSVFIVTLNTGGMTWNNVTLPNQASTIILNSIFTVGGTATSSQSIIYLGTSGFDYYNWTSSINNTRTWTLVSGVSYRIRNSMLCIGGASVATKNAFVSSIPGSQAILTVDQGSTLDLQYLYATDIDSSLGRTIWSYKGVLSNTLNWKNLPTNGPGTISYSS